VMSADTETKTLFSSPINYMFNKILFCGVFADRL